MLIATSTGRVPGHLRSGPPTTTTTVVLRHVYWELWAGPGFILVCSSIYLSDQTVDSRVESSSSDGALGPLLRRGLPTSGSDEPNWNHVLHHWLPLRQMGQYHVINEKEGAEVEETREGKSSRALNGLAGSGSDPTTHRRSPTSGLFLCEQAAVLLPGTGGNPEKDASVRHFHCDSIGSAAAGANRPGLQAPS